MSDELQPAKALAELTRSDIVFTWQDHEQYWRPNLHQDIRDCRLAYQGVSQFCIPDEFDIENKEQLIVNLPQKRSVPLKMVNILERRRPRVRRYAVGSSHTPRALGISSNVETWANAVADEVINWSSLIGKIFLEGACAVTIVPSTAAWQKTPDFFDTIDDRKYKKLNGDRQSNYKLNDTTGRYERVGGDGTKVPKRTYQRDAKGRAADDKYYAEPGKRRGFKIDKKQSRKAYKKEQSAYLAHRLPFTTRVLSATDAIPVFGPGEKLEKLITREEFSEDVMLQRGLRWDASPQAAIVKKGEVADGAVILYTLWEYDEDGDPYVEYVIDGCRTWWNADKDLNQVDAKINLREECGFTELPVKWVWGLHLESDDPTTKGIPFLKPTLASLTTAEALLTFKTIHAYKHAFTSWVFEVNPEVARVRPEVFLTNGQPRTQVIKPMMGIYMAAKPHALTPPSVGPDVNDLTRTLLQGSNAMADPNLATGGGDASSGHDRSLSRDYLETSMNQVLTAGLEAYKFLVERIIEAACFISDEFDVFVPVYANVKVPQARSGPNKDAKRRQVVELDPSWIGEIYEVETYYPKAGAEDIAMITVLAQLYKEGLLTFYEFREQALGDEAPEDSLIAIWIDQELKTDEGRAVIAKRTLDLYGEDMDAEMKKLVEDGIMTKDGSPVASLLPPPHPGAVPDGTHIPNGGPAPAAPPGAPNQAPMVGAPGPMTMPNSIVGGTVAGSSEMNGIRNDSMARVDQGLGIQGTGQ